MAYSVVSLTFAIASAGVVAGAYTAVGGIRSVVWTDTLQAGVLLAGALAVLGVLGLESAGGLAGILDWASAADRTRVFHFDPWIALRDSSPFGVSLVGGFFLTLATHGTDQDMVQRLLTTRTGRQGSGALISTGLVNFPLVALFLLLGTALWAYYQTDLGAFARDYSIADDKRIFAIFVFQEMPAGLRGLIFAGLFAAAMSSLDSALNSLVMMMRHSGA